MSAVETAMDGGMSTAVATDAPVTLTETAAAKLSGVIEEKGLSNDFGLRVFVKGGGCGGMQYGMTFDEQKREGDNVFESHGVKVYVDPTSMFYVKGASIDYQDSLMGGGFNIENPNATSSCGCGSSFRTSHNHAGEEVPQNCGV